MSEIVNIPADLLPGDLLLYGDSQFSNELVKWKEGDPDTDHIEVYLGNRTTFASRNGIGLNLYDFDPSGLVHVRRPLGTFDLASVMAWVPSVKGAPYGWGDIAADLDLPEKDQSGITPAATLMKTGADCSHTAALVMIVGKTPQFDATCNFRKLTPRDFKIVRESREIWTILRSEAPARQVAQPETVRVS